MRISSAGTFHCTWNFQDFTESPLGTRQVTIETTARYGVNTNTPGIITGDLRSFKTTTNTSLTVSNLVNGRSYRVSFYGPLTPWGTNKVTVITNNFDADVSGLVNAVDHLGGALVSDSGTVAYSQAGADARFHNVSGDTSTNPVFRGTVTFPATDVQDYVWRSTNNTGAGFWAVATATTATTATNTPDGLPLQRPPYNINLGSLRNFRNELTGLSNMVFWTMSDDAISPHVRMRTLLRESFPLGGGVAQAGWGFSAGTITQPAFSGTQDPWVDYVGMADGSSITNNWQGFAPVTGGTILMLWKSNGFGVLTVRTQAYNNGTFSGAVGTVTAVDMNNSSVLSPFTTNIAINSATPVAVSLYSSGTNLVWHAFQYSLGRPGFAMVPMVGANFDIHHLMTNAFKSNTFRTFLSAVRPTLITQADKNASNSLYTGATLFHNMLTNAGLASDYAMFTEIPTTNDLAASRSERQAVLKAALDTGRAAVDSYSIFDGLEQPGLAPSYSDAVHLTAAANASATGESLGWMGFNRDDFARLQGGSYQQLLATNVVAAGIGHPSSSGAINVSNTFNMGYSGTRVQVADKSGLVSAVSAGSQFLNLYSGNNNHGLGVGSLGGVVGGYWFSDGSILFGTPSALRVRFNVADNTYGFASTVTVTNGGIALLGSSQILITAGSGDPNNVVTAPVGSLFLRTNGGANSTLYVKESGTGNTGWVAK